MADSPNTGEVKVVLRIDTNEAKAKVAEVERRLRNNERERRFVVERVNKDGFGAKSGGGNSGSTIADKLLQRVIPKAGGYNPQIQINSLARFTSAFKNSFAGNPGANAPLGGQPTIAGMIGNAIGKVGGITNPFPTGGISGANATGGTGSTLALAAVLYKGLEKLSKFSGLAEAYLMKSGEAASKTSAGHFFNEANSTFSYINNYIGSYKDAEQRLADWDDTVAAVTGKLPDTQFYRPKFQRMAAAERQFQEMVARNMAMTKAGAMGNSAVVDQLEDAVAHSISR